MSKEKVENSTPESDNYQDDVSLEQEQWNEEEMIEEIEDGGELKQQPESSYRQPLWVSMFAIIGIFIGSTLVGGLAKLLVIKTAGASEGFGNFLAYLVTFSITIGFALWIVIARGAKKPIIRFSLRKVDPTVVLWGLILIIVTAVVIEPILALFPDTNVDLLRNITTSGGWAMVTSIILAPFLEEILFRGIIQENVTREYGGLIGVVFASLLFALAHITVPQQAANAFFMGLILGYIYIKTQSLLPVIIIHGLNNAIAYIMMSLFESGAVMMRDVIANDVIYWTVYGICVFIFLLAVVNITMHLSKVEGEKFAKRRKNK